MPSHLHLSLFFVLGLAAGSAPQSAEPAQSGAGTRQDPVLLAPPGSATVMVDSTAIGVFEVRASRLRPPAQPRHVDLIERDLDREDVTSAADVGVLLPSTRVNVNSRGESVIQVRAASERHVRVFLDDIPLTLPWDERVDLSMIPVDAIGAVDSEAGMSSVLNGPNALAGVVRLRSRDVPAHSSHSRLGVRAGEAAAYQTQALHVRRGERWSVLGAASWRQQGASLVPSEFEGALHQYPGRSRTNTDFEQLAFLARLGREREDGGSLRLLVHGVDGEKGVAPEAHLEDARFWRYPKIQRLLTGLSLRQPLGPSWQLQASVSADFARQQIREFSDDGYQTPALEPGVSFEDGRDRTVSARVLVRRALTSRSALTIAGDGRATQHRERLQIGGPELSYAQTLGSWTAQWQRQMSGAVDLVVGGGFEIAATPETADKPSRDATRAPVWQAGASWRVDERIRLGASASRRSRFPSLRELYSGALDRFVPNPDLEPERQDLVEADASVQGSRASARTALFASWLDGGIERVGLEDGRFQRRNVDSIRTLGLELHTVARVGKRLEAQVQHTFLFVRSVENGNTTSLVEDRPDYLSRASLSWVDPSGLSLRLETQVTGLRHSADTNDTCDGLRALPPQASWNARISYETFPAGALSAVEVFVRVNNLFDQYVGSQTGLPEPGRTAQAGLRVSLGDG